ncbi:MAG TPA: hypothetical protein PKH07_10170 [bacterium]|nr:hypothetical protein [bacterium]
MENQNLEAELLLVECNDSPWCETSLDRQNLLLRNVCLLGPNSRNGRRYPDSVIQEALGFFDGCRAYLNHPTQGQSGQGVCRDVRDLVGRYESPRIEGGKLRADLRLLPQHADLVFSLAETMPESVGMSINARGRTCVRDGEEIVQAITEIKSVDLVTDPAATRGLFESLTKRETSDKESVLWSDLDVASLTARRPDLIEQLERPLRETLHELRDQSAQQARRANVQEALRCANLPLELVSDIFIETLLEAHDDEHIHRLIEDRKSTAQQSKAVRTQSQEKGFRAGGLTDQEFYGSTRKRR